MFKNKLDWLQWISEVQALVQSGLAYTDNEFDKQRYDRLNEMIAALGAHCSNQPLPEVKNIFSLEKGYATPKIDVRAVILKNDKLLLVKERADGLWTLPGGWADVNGSPSEAVIREALEETGYHVSVLKLLAFWDKQKHDHPPQWPHAYKCFFHCDILRGAFKENLETTELNFFDWDALPPLSTHRVTASQLHKLRLLLNNSEATSFD